MNIIELARQSGFFVSTELRDDPSHERFERFAAAVIAARDAELIAGVGEVSAWLFKDMTWTPISAMGRDHGGAPAYSAEQVAGVVAKKDALIKEMQQDNLDWMKRSVGQEKRIAELEAARMAYAREFALNADGEPDVGNIHANIRAMKDALRVALNSLENSVDCVRAEYETDWRHGLPTRKAQLDSMKQDYEAHEAAIEKCKEVLHD